MAVLLGIFSIFLMSQAAFAVIGDIPGVNFNVLKIIFGGEVPDAMLEPQNVFQQLLLPFLAVFFVMFGIMEELNFFKNHASIHAALALVIALMSSVSGTLLWTVRWLYGAVGWLGAMGFGFLLLAGIAFWIYGRGKGLKRAYFDVYKTEKEITHLDKEISELNAEAATLKKSEEFAGVEADKIEKKVDKLLGEAEKKEKEKQNKQKHLSQIYG